MTHHSKNHNTLTHSPSSFLVEQTQINRLRFLRLLDAIKCSSNHLIWSCLTKKWNLIKRDRNIPNSVAVTAIDMILLKVVF